MNEQEIGERNREFFNRINREYDALPEEQRSGIEPEEILHAIGVAVLGTEADLIMPTVAAYSTQGTQLNLAQVCDPRNIFFYEFSDVFDFEGSIGQTGFKWNFLLIDQNYFRVHDPFHCVHDGHYFVGGVDVRKAEPTAMLLLIQPELDESILETAVGEAFNGVAKIPATREEANTLGEKLKEQYIVRHLGLQGKIDFVHALAALEYPGMKGLLYHRMKTIAEEMAGPDTAFGVLQDVRKRLEEQPTSVVGSQRYQNG